MAQHTLARGHICPDCDGHASVAITLGGRTPAGHLRTITAHCKACHGTGTRQSGRTGSPSASAARAGR